jgi:hypothetical protein
VEAIVILPSHKVARRAFSVALAVWFVFLSLSIHGLHRYNGGQWNTDDAGTRVVEHAGEAMHGAAVRVTAPPEFDDDAMADQGLCPACLFLKNCKQSANFWISKAPCATPNGPALDRADVCRTSHVVTCGSPRAPPAPLT